MARFLLMASLVGARWAAGLGAAPADSSRVQLGTAVDKSNTSQQRTGSSAHVIDEVCLPLGNGLGSICPTVYHSPDFADTDRDGTCPRTSVCGGSEAHCASKGAQLCSRIQYDTAFPDYDVNQMPFQISFGNRVSGGYLMTRDMLWQNYAHGQGPAWGYRMIYFNAFSQVGNNWTLSEFEANINYWFNSWHGCCESENRYFMCCTPGSHWSLLHRCGYCGPNDGGNGYDHRSNREECMQRCESEGASFMTYGSSTSPYDCACFTSCDSPTFYADTHPSDCKGNSYAMATATPAPTVATAPPAGGAGAGASAVGDPHLQNIHGDRFDLMKAGKHVLINIPRGQGADQALLRVQARASRLGGHCADMYFQELNVTGSWAEAKQPGGYHYSVWPHEIKIPEWVALGKVELKVVHGLTDGGLRYLNLYVKHLGRAGFAVGGLLGEDDHGDVIIPPEACVRRLSLVNDMVEDAKRKAPQVFSVAEASLA